MAGKRDPLVELIRKALGPDCGCLRRMEQMPCDNGLAHDALRRIEKRLEGRRKRRKR